MRQRRAAAALGQFLQVRALGTLQAPKDIGHRLFAVRLHLVGQFSVAIGGFGLHGQGMGQERFDGLDGQARSAMLSALMVRTVLPVRLRALRRLELRPVRRARPFVQHPAHIEAVIGHQAACGARGVVGAIDNGGTHLVAPGRLLGPERDTGG